MAEVVPQVDEKGTKQQIATAAAFGARRELMQRVQVGMVGLVGVLLIVGLANFMTRNARMDDATTTVAADRTAVTGGAANAVAANPNEPLADLGVTPSSDPTLSNDPSLGATPAVPDLEPDPQLDTPMDRDPRQANRRQ